MDTTGKPKVFQISVARKGPLDNEARQILLKEIARAAQKAGEDDDILVCIVKIDENSHPINNVRIEVK